MSPTLAELESALAKGALEDWLVRLGDRDASAVVRRALSIDRRLSLSSPASLGSLLLARTKDVAELSSFHAGWERELDARGAPWVRSLRGLPVAAGLVAELHGDEALDLRRLRIPKFESEDVLVVEAREFPERARDDRLRWNWRSGDVRLEARPAGPARSQYPRFQRDGWAPVFLVRDEGAAPVELPCPKEGSASAFFHEPLNRIYVYGTEDEYAGGFVYILDATTLEVIREVVTQRPVANVKTCDVDDLHLLCCFNDLVLWKGNATRALPLPDEGVLSPSGEHIATVGEGVRIWSVAELEQRRPRSSVFPATFDPSGRRLVSGTTLYDARSGSSIEHLPAWITDYLEGGPAHPRVFVGTQYIANEHEQLFETSSGRSLEIQSMRDAPATGFPQWYCVAYDRTGSRLAAMHTHEPGCTVYSLPSGANLAEVPAAGTALAIHPDGEIIAARDGLVVAVHDLSGTLLLRLLHPSGEPTDEYSTSERDSLRFSDDGEWLGSFVKGDGWRIWFRDGTLREHLVERAAIDGLSGFAPPSPTDWTVESGSATRFVHSSTGTVITLPAAGPWVTNPADPHILASDALHVELRGGAT